MWKELLSYYFSTGDTQFFWKEQINAFQWLPQIFHKEFGFGASLLSSLWLGYPFQIFLKVLSAIGLSWFFIEKLLWMSVCVLALYSSFRLTKHWLGSIIYVCNTYALLLFIGGQLGVAFAFAFSPFVLLQFQKKSIIRNGLLFALLVLLDLRIAYLVAAAVALWYVVNKTFSMFVPFFFSLCIAVSVHLYWILPTVFASGGTADLSAEFTNPAMLQFLSFADFSHALSLLHPNWPDNLFGKIYFMQPEFLFIPILAFSSLLLLKQKTEHTKRIWYFSLLALIGAFFAKGVNPPFGEMFTWLFTYVPGFVMFRDPTKFYLYIAIGYSVLIPFIVKKYSKIVTILFLFFWVFTIRAIHIVPVKLPAEYVQLKDLLVADTIPSRTLWIPQKENFAYYSDTHPILTATSAAAIDSSVKYIIVPIDAGRRIFLNDYVYDASLRTTVINDLSTHFERNTTFTDLAVFENPSFTSVHTYVPSNIARQEQLSRVGLGISIGFVSLWILWIFLH